MHTPHTVTRAARDVTRRFWAPGRVNLIGEHTDHAGGLALPAAIGLGVCLEGTAARTTAVRSDAGDLERLVAAVEEELAALGHDGSGFAGRLTATLPAGAGLASSAAVGVVLALALCAARDVVLAPIELAQLARRVEHRATGVPCGILDQAACVLGTPNHATLLDTSSLDHRQVRLPSGLSILVVDSRVRRALANTAYESRRGELLEAVGGADDAVHRSRLRHFTSENERVRETVAALESDPPALDRVGRLFRESHESLRRDFAVSTPELDLLVDLAYEHGARAARMTGAGFGGSIVALVDTPDARMVADRVLERYLLRAGTPASAYVTEAAAGAHELGRGLPPSLA